MPAKKPRPGKRFRLRLYERLFEMIRWPTFLLIFASYVLWWISPDRPFLSFGRDLLLLVSAISFLLYVASLVAPTLCFVQCRADQIIISTAVYRVSISYARVSGIKPLSVGVIYPLKKQGWSQRRFLRPLFHEQKTGQLTAVGMELTKYPLPIRWLKLWFNEYMFMPGTPGFLFIVRDWMSLSRQIEDYREQWRARHSTKVVKSVSIASEVLSKGDKR